MSAWRPGIGWELQQWVARTLPKVQINTALFIYPGLDSQCPSHSTGTWSFSTVGQTPVGKFKALNFLRRLLSQSLGLNFKFVRICFQPGYKSMTTQHSRKKVWVNTQSPWSVFLKLIILEFLDQDLHFCWMIKRATKRQPIEWGHKSRGTSINAEWFFWHLRSTQKMFSFFPVSLLFLFLSYIYSQAMGARGKTDTGTSHLIRESKTKWKPFESDEFQINTWEMWFPWDLELPGN